MAQCRRIIVIRDRRSGSRGQVLDGVGVMARGGHVLGRRAQAAGFHLRTARILSLSSPHRFNSTASVHPSSIPVSVTALVHLTKLHDLKRCVLTAARGRHEAFTDPAL